MVSSPLVGRTNELARVREAVDRALGGHGAVVMLVGEPGIGKTRLADAAATYGAERGFHVAWGRAWEAGGAPAYWPWLEAFRSLGIDAPFADGGAEASDRIVSSVEAQHSRFVQFDRALELLRKASRDHPILLVLDDLHAADLPSLVFLQLVVRGLRAGARIAIVGTYRDAEARITPAVGTPLAKIGREGDVLHVGRLAPEDVAAWVQTIDPNATATRAHEVHTITDGNPLFVAEFLRVRGNVGTGRLPDGLRAIIDEHLARVPADTRDVLAAMSVAGREAMLDDIAALSGFEHDVVARHVAAATEAGILQSSTHQTNRHAFAHILIRERLYAELDPARRRAIHLAAGDRFAARNDLASAAHHLIEAIPTAPAERAASIAEAAAQHAITQLAYEEAEALMRRALDALPGEPVSERRVGLEIMHAESLMRVGETNAGREAAARAAERAKRLGHGRLLARAALAYSTELVSGRIDRFMADLLQAALDGLAPEERALRARVTSRLAAALVPPRAHEEVPHILALAHDAVAIARELGDPDTLLYTLRYAGSASNYLLSAFERFKHAQEMIALAESLDRPVLFLEIAPLRISTLRENGFRADADRILDEYLQRLRQFPQPYYQWRAPLALAMHALLDGDFDRADRLAAEAHAIAVEHDVAAGKICWALHRIGAGLLRGDRGMIEADAEQIIATVGRIESIAPLNLLVLALLGRTDEAKRRLSSLEIAAENFPWAVMLGEAAVVLEDRTLAKSVLESLRGHARVNPAFWGLHFTSLFGPAARIAGDLARLLEQEDLAEEFYREALAYAERMGSPALVSQVQSRIRTRPTEAAPPSRKASLAIEIFLTQEGDVWRIRASTGAAVVLKDAKGLHYLAELVRNPGRELHVTQLVDLEEPAGDAGPVLDGKAKAAYATRLSALRDDLEEARRFGDIGRTERAEAEIDALGDQLAAAVGLGGRDRKLGSHVERARINVQRRLKDVLKRVAEQDEALGRTLNAFVKTGTWCSFTPI